MIKRFVASSMLSLSGIFFLHSASAQTFDDCTVLAARAESAEIEGDGLVAIIAAAQELECAFASDESWTAGAPPEPAPAEPEDTILEVQSPGVTEPVVEELGALQQQYEDLVALFRQAQVDLAEARDRERVAQAQLNDREEDLSELATRLARTEAELADATTETERLRAQLADVQPRPFDDPVNEEVLAALREENEAQAAIVEQQEAQVTQYAERLASLQAEMLELVADREGLEAQLATALEAVQQHEGRIEAIESEMASLEDTATEFAAAERRAQLRADAFESALEDMLRSYVELQFLSRGIQSCSTIHTSLSYLGDTIGFTISGEVLGEAAAEAAREIFFPIDMAVVVEVTSPSSGMCTRVIGAYQVVDNGDGLLGTASRSDALQYLNSLAVLEDCAEFGEFVETSEEMASYRDATAPHQRGVWVRDGASGRLAACVWSGSSYRPVLQSSRYEDLVIVFRGND